MTLLDVKATLNEYKIPESLYSLYGGLHFDAFCIGKTDSIWEVYYSERGAKSMTKHFTDEDAACHYFLKFLFSDYAMQTKYGPFETKFSNGHLI